RAWGSAGATSRGPSQGCRFGACGTTWPASPRAAGFPLPRSTVHPRAIDGRWRDRADEATSSPLASEAASRLLSSPGLSPLDQSPVGSPTSTPNFVGRKGSFLKDQTRSFLVARILADFRIGREPWSPV